MLGQSPAVCYWCTYDILSTKRA